MYNDYYGEEMDREEIRELESEAMDRLSGDDCCIDEQQAAEQRIGA